MPNMHLTVSRLRALCLTCTLIAACHTPPPAPPAPLHLYTKGEKPPTDPNGFLLNPTWQLGNPEDTVPDIEDACRFRVETKHLERRVLHTTRRDCLADDERKIVSLNEIPTALGLGLECVTGASGKVKGHVNWYPVTATGQLVWNSFSAGAGDHDVNMDLIAHTSAVTTGNRHVAEYNNQRAYHLESYYEETFGRLPDADNTFWHALKAAHEDNDRASKLVDHRFAIVTGVFGVDGVHGFHSELHPVLAMAVLIDTVKKNDATVLERWAIMLRNQGSEGDCAEGTLPMHTTAAAGGGQGFLFNLGKWTGAKPVAARLLSAWSRPEGYKPIALFTETSDVFISLDHPQPEPSQDDFLFFGTVELEWVRDAQPHDWKERFVQWLPTKGHEINVAEIPIEDAVYRSAGTTPTDLEHGPVTPQVNAPVRVQRTAPWPVPSKVTGLDCYDRDSSNELCFKEARWVVAATQADGGWFPALSRFRYPSSSYFAGDDLWHSIVNIVYTLGDRWDLRADRLTPKPNTKDFDKHAASRCIGWNDSRDDTRCGVSLRWNPYLSPNSVHLSEKFVLTPYTVGQFGLSVVDRPHESLNHGLGFTLGFGLGLQAEIGNKDLFIERQTMSRSWYQNQWVTTLGWQWPFGRRELK